MKVFVGGMAILGPGLDGWEAGREVLAGRRPYVATPCTPPAPPSLPPNERRRASAAIRLAMAVADAAVAATGLEPTKLASVFASSNGDGAVVGAILEALAGPQRIVSPTQFHNSVHNTPAAYWAIGAGGMGGSTSFGCHDATFAAALLHAAAKTTARREPVLLCAYDAPLPAPLSAARPTADPFATAMVLTPEPAPASAARLEIRFVAEPVPEASRPRLDALWPLHDGNAAARALPLLETLARKEPALLRFDHLGDSHVVVEVGPW